MKIGNGNFLVVQLRRFYAAWFANAFCFAILNSEWLTESNECKCCDWSDLSVATSGLTTHDWTVCQLITHNAHTGNPGFCTSSLKKNNFTKLILGHGNNTKWILILAMLGCGKLGRVEPNHSHSRNFVAGKPMPEWRNCSNHNIVAIGTDKTPPRMAPFSWKLCPEPVRKGSNSIGLRLTLTVTFLSTHWAVQWWPRLDTSVCAVVPWVQMTWGWKESAP